MYRVGHVYKIYSELNDTEIYIGSTMQLLKYRFDKHKKSYDEYNQQLQTKRITCYDIFDKYDVDTCKIELIKSYPICDRKHLFMYEQLYINKLRCINKMTAFQILYKEWNRLYYQRNKEQISQKTKVYREEYKEHYKQYNKRYYEKNKEQILQREKQYRQQNSEMIECECGSIIKKYKMTDHRKSNKHREFLKKR